MPINEMRPLSLPEVKNLIKGKEESKDIAGFIKKFSKMDIKNAKEMRKELENLGLIKLKPEHIVKIIDLLPEDAADINKIFADTSLDENEVNKILEIIKKHK